MFISNLIECWTKRPYCRKIKIYFHEIFCKGKQQINFETFSDFFKHWPSLANASYNINYNWHKKPIQFHNEPIWTTRDETHDQWRNFSTFNDSTIMVILKPLIVEEIW